MLSALQIIILLPLMNVSVPANAGMFFKELAAIAAFDYFETSEFIEDLLDLLPRDPINEKFESTGFESVYFMNNLGTLLLVITF